MSNPNPDLLMRRATGNDLEQIVRLLIDDDLGAKREKLSLPLVPSYWDAFYAIDRSPNDELIVAELEGKVVGTFHLTFLTHLTYQGSKLAQIEEVRIAREFRGQGLGQIMMKWAIDRARQMKCHRVQLTTNKVRKDAHRFYERLGFSPTHEGMKLIL